MRSFSEVAPKGETTSTSSRPDIAGAVWWDVAGSPPAQAAKPITSTRMVALPTSEYRISAAYVVMREPLGES